MRKQDLVKKVADSSKQSEAQANTAVSAVFDAIADSLAHGDDVTISGFGSFKVVKRSAREGRNPQTGEPMTIPARKSASFTPGTQLKRSVNTD